MFQWRSGDHVVMPAQSNGAAAFGSRPVGNAQHKLVRYHDALGITAIGRRLVVTIGTVVGEGGDFFAVLLKALCAGIAMLARVDQATHADHVAGLERSDFGAYGSDPADDLVPGTIGYLAPPHSLRAWWMSEWQDAAIRIRSPHRPDAGHAARIGEAPEVWWQICAA